MQLSPAFQQAILEAHQNAKTITNLQQQVTAQANEITNLRRLLDTAVGPIDTALKCEQAAHAHTKGVLAQQWHALESFHNYNRLISNLEEDNAHLIATLLDVKNSTDTELAKMMDHISALEEDLQRVNGA